MSYDYHEVGSYADSGCGCGCGCNDTCTCGEYNYNGRSGHGTRTIIAEPKRSSATAKTALG